MEFCFAGTRTLLENIERAYCLDGPQYYRPSGSPGPPVYRHLIRSCGVYIYSFSTANELNPLDFPLVSPIRISQQSIQLTPGPFPLCPALSLQLQSNIYSRWILGSEKGLTKYHSQASSHRILFRNDI